MSRGEKYTNIVIAVIWAFILLVIYLIFVYRDLFIQCDTEESPFCFTLTCANDSTETCGNYAYRCVDDGVICSSTPYTVRPIDSSDNLCG